MSDNSNSTGSSASSTNSWTILSPEEAAVESLGPVDDGTESLGDVPSLSEELAGAILEVKPCEAEAAVETVLTEEGLQVCQETAPDEASEGPVPSSPAPVSPVPSSPAHLSPSTSSHVLYDPESQPPIIHDMVTSSPSDDHQLAAIPVDLVTPLDSPFAEPPSAEFETGLNFPVSESPTSATLLVSPFVKPPSAENESEYTVTDSESPIPAVLTPDISIDTLLPAETLVLDDPVLSAEPNTSLESLSESGPPSDVYTDISPSLDVLETPESPAPETVEEEPAVEKEETEHPEKEAFPPFDFGQVDASKEEDGLRRRNVPPSEPPRPRTSDEEDDEEMEFRLAEKKDEKPGGLSLTTCIIGALVLLCLGSLFLTDDDSSELSDGNQDWSSDDVTNLLDKLAQENQEISHLEAQLQSQEEELDSALKASTAKEKGEEDLEKENAKLKEDLSSMPGLKEELEALRARVAEISQLTASDDMPTPMASSTPPPSGKPEESQPSAKDPERKGSPKDGGKMKEELQRQKVLLEESRKRLEGMKRGGGHRKGVREGLANVQKRLTEQVEKLGKKKPWEASSKWNAKKGKDNGKAHWKKGEKDLRHDKDDHHNGGGKDWKHKQNSHKQNSHKEAWRKNQDEWDRKKDERRSDREKRKQDRPWYKRPTKDSNNHHHHHHHRQPLHEHHQHHHQTHPAQQYDATFWKHQQEKLSRNVRPRSSCGSADECADQEGLYPVELAEFEELLEGYLSKLEVATPVNKDKLRKLIGQFFVDGVFVHDRILFSEFAEDVADILEDMADVGEEDPTDDDALEEEMEEFEREALWKFAVAA